MCRQLEPARKPMTRSGLTLFLAALLLQMPAGRTAPLDKEGCAKLKVEQGELEHAGTRGNMGKGPQRANPPPKGEAKQEPAPGPASAEAKALEKKTGPAAKKAKSKKADDAYRAPVGEPGSNPFANQVAPKQ